MCSSASFLPGLSTTCLTWGTGRVCWRETATTHWTITSGIMWSSHETLPTHIRSRWTQSQSPRMSTGPRTLTSKVPHLCFWKNSNYFHDEGQPRVINLNDLTSKKTCSWALTPWPPWTQRLKMISQKVLQLTYCILELYMLAWQTSRQTTGHTSNYHSQM